MPYNPTVTDHSGEFLAGGIAGAANALVNGYQQGQLTAAEVAKLTGDVNAYQQAGILTADAAQKFLDGNLAKKREIASQGAAAFALQQQQLENNFKQQRLDQEGQRITAEDFTPSPETLSATAANGYLWAQQSKHGGTYLKKQDAPGTGTPSETELPESGATVVDLGNGKRALVRPTAAKPMNSSDAIQLGQWSKTLATNLQALNDHTTAIGNGDNSYFNPDVAEKGAGKHWPFGKSREERVNELLIQNRGLQTQMDALTQGRGGAANDVPTGGGNAPASQVSPTPGGGAQTGYQPGTRYKRGDGSWTTYIGGDPNNAASWK